MAYGHLYIRVQRTNEESSRYFNPLKSRDIIKHIIVRTKRNSAILFLLEKLKRDTKHALGVLSTADISQNLHPLPFYFIQLAKGHSPSKN